MLRSVSFGDHFEANDVPALSQATNSESKPSNHKGDSSAHLQVDLEGSLIYHGATSIYRSDVVNPTTSAVLDDLSLLPLSYYTSDAKFEHVAEHFGINLQDELVENALLQFFKWQYPHFMFIYREAFLRDHFSERANCKYWSSALLLSICALGTLMSPEQRHRQASEQFFSAAESILIVSGFTKPSVVTVQGFLCLAFYEIGRGNLSKGWGFSGIAFRMAQDLGMQRDPKQWKSHDVTLVTEEDMEIRRRIFWGCYTSDKLISLILGRPVHLSHDDAEVQTAERLPDFPEMKPWLPAGFDDCNSGLGDVNPLIPCFKAQIGLSKIIENMLSKLFSAKASLKGLGRQTCLDDINLALCKWYEELPNCVKWNRWEPTSNILIPSVAALHLLFQSARIALNYDQATSNQCSEETESARKCCISSAEDITYIMRKYRSQYGLNHSPLVMVYGVMQACRAHTVFGTHDEAQYLLRSLDECCAAWCLAHQTRLRLTHDGT
ncbi:transcription factor [Colletotrichum truncatum]|uniref:Transcription factor n=1 Tax=Colletotrichum truncatum TaxID=5467 RepID=A0ACC3YE08_COLTU|nr:transcription factor [Colletotrichum truncatum]KAF6790204.1 transcription factor [Colletotrichum truncatum]